MNCRVFRSQLYHFQADQLPDDQRRSVQVHLDGCEDCARLLAVEEGLLRAVRSRLRPQPAPPGLATRVRAALDDLVPKPGPLSWYRRPWFATAAASLLLAVLLVPGVGRETPSMLPPGELFDVASELVTVVDHDCDRAGRNLEQQKGCRANHHLNVLKTAQGRYWHINLDRDSHRRLLVDPELRGHRLKVDGKYYPRIRTLQMTHFEDLGT